jgi:Bacterial Ig-like domain
MKLVNKTFWAIALLALVTFVSCEDDDPSALKIVSVTSTGTNLTTGNEETVDLNGATAATSVPPDGVVTVTFNKEVSASSISATSITLNNGTANVALEFDVTGAVLVITATGNLQQGTLHTLTITSAVSAADGGKVSTASRAFTTAGTAPAVVPQADKLVVYLPFNGSVVDAKGHTVLNSNVGFATDRFGNVESSADFNGTTNYAGIQYAADMSNANTTVSYWLKLPASAAYASHIGTTSAGNIKQYVTFCIGGNNGTYHEWNRFTCCELGFDIDVLKYFTNHVNTGTASALAGSSIEMKNEGNPGGDRVIEVNNTNWIEDGTGVWMHIATSWNATTRTKSFYINGVPSTVYTLTPSAEFALGAATIDAAGIDLDASNSKNLYIGSGVPFWATKTATGITPFRSEIPFAYKGQMDDFRMYSVALTNAEVLALYNAEKPN